MEFNLEKMAQEVSRRALDETEYKGKTLREWVELLAYFDTWGCELCSGAKFVSGIAYSEKVKDGANGVQAVSFSDEGADCDFNYCPNCGKPLTDRARKELENKFFRGDRRP